MKASFHKFTAALFAACIFTLFACSSDDGGFAYGSFSYGGQTYKTIVIGTQTWMAENLNYNASGSKCYDNDPANCVKYGRLYDWQTAMTACPSGWHLPTNVEWDVLINHAGGENNAGKKLKTRTGWNNSGNGTDDYGFSAMPGGGGNSDGSFGNVGNDGYWWSASEIESSSNSAYRRMMHYNYETVYLNAGYKPYPVSVRCVKDN